MFRLYLQLEPTVSPSELAFTDEELLTIAGRIPRDWQTLGIKLGLVYTTLDNIHLRHVSNVQQAGVEMLQVWRRERGDQATRSVLRDALKSIGFGRLAQEVF